MKKILFVLMMGICLVGHSQVVRFGLKGGVNFSNFNGGISGIDYKTKTNFHAGALVQLKLMENFALQPEVLYSSQGAEIKGVGDFNLDYVSVPVLAKFYLMTDKLSVDFGPQFSFLVKESGKVYDQVVNDKQGESFDFGLAAGLGLQVTHNFWIQGRYGLGLTEANKNAEVKNATFQISAAYVF